MSERRQFFRFDMRGNAKKKLEDTAGAADQMAAGLGRARETSDKLATSMAAHMIGLTELIDTVKRGIKEYSEFEAAQGRLGASFAKSKTSFKDQQRAYALADRAAIKYGISVNESLDALRRLNDATSDSKTAMEDYALAVNIAQAENMSIKDTAELLAKARKGEVEEVKKLRGINKDLAESIGQIADAGERGGYAISILADEYRGAAKATAGMEDGLKAADESRKAAEAGLGGLAVALGKVIGVVRTGDGELTWFDTFAYGLKELADMANKSAEEINRLTKSFNTMAANEVVAMLISGKSFADIMGEADSRTAREAAAGGGLDPDLPADLLAKYNKEIAKINLSESAKVRTELTKMAVEEINKEFAKRTEGTPSQTMDFEPMTFKPLKKKGDKKKPPKGRRGPSDAQVMGDLSSLVGGAFDPAKAEADERIKYEAAVAKEVLRINEDLAERKIATQEKLVQKMKQDKAERERIEKEHADRVKEFEDSKAEAQMIGLDAAIGIADQLGANESVIAGMRAAMEIGEGLAALGPTPAMPFGNPAGAAAHFAAAAQFGVAAAMAGGGGGVAKKGGGGSAAVNAANMERNNRQQSSGPTETKIVLDFSRSVGVGPLAARELAQEVKRGLDMTTGNGRIF